MYDSDKKFNQENAKAYYEDSIKQGILADKTKVERCIPRITEVSRDHTELPSGYKENIVWQENKDLVNHPSHYTFSKYEVLDVLQAWFPDAPLLWQVVKYVARAKHKGNYLQDLQKARVYLDRAMDEYVQSNSTTTRG